MKTKSCTILTAVVFACEVALAIGTLLVFHACGKTDEGSYMACHWAQMAVVTLAVVAAISSLIALAAKNPSFVRGLLVGQIPVIAAAAIIPKNIINLCMMSTMRCHSTMRPAVIVLCVIILVLLLVNVVTTAGKAKVDEANK